MLVHKFQHVTKGLLSPARQKEIIQAVQSLPTQGLAPLHLLCRLSGRSHSKNDHSLAMKEIS
ncbi:MAG: hypothetical protein MZU95_02470 [Desulfomicrobium escambiense]|nr:hypothetical protein [Desulfomicrobium escambiense]